jgi:hypothetical protein
VAPDERMVWLRVETLQPVGRHYFRSLIFCATPWFSNSAIRTTHKHGPSTSVRKGNEAWFVWEKRWVRELAKESHERVTNANYGHQAWKQ